MDNSKEICGVGGREGTETEGGVKLPYSDSAPRKEDNSKIPPPWKRWSHFAFISKTEEGFGLAGTMRPGAFMGLFGLCG